MTARENGGPSKAAATMTPVALGGRVHFSTHAPSKRSIGRERALDIYLPLERLDAWDSVSGAYAARRLRHILARREVLDERRLRAYERRHAMRGAA